MITKHVLRSVCPNGSPKHMHLVCLTPNQKWVIWLLPSKQNLPVFYLCISYIEVRTELHIYFPGYFRVAKPLQHSTIFYFNYFLLFRTLLVDVIVTWYKSICYGTIRIIHWGRRGTKRPLSVWMHLFVFVLGVYSFTFFVFQLFLFLTHVNHHALQNHTS